MLRRARPSGRAVLAPAVALVALFATALPAQQRGVHPVSGRVYAGTMGVQGAPWLDRNERDREEDPDLAVRLLRIQKGSTIAGVRAALEDARSEAVVVVVAPAAPRARWPCD